MTLSEAEEYYHNKGQEDYPEFNPPNSSIVEEVVGHTKFELACIAAYKAGWRHAKEQAGD